MQKLCRPVDARMEEPTRVKKRGRRGVEVRVPRTRARRTREKRGFSEDMHGVVGDNHRGLKKNAKSRKQEKSIERERGRKEGSASEMHTVRV